MTEIIRAAMVIARRDYVATVFSKAFLLFLLGPLLPLIAGVGFGALGARQDRAETHPTIAALASPEDGRALLAARMRLAARLGDDALPDIRIVAPAGPGISQVARLLGDPKDRVVAVMTGGLAAPMLVGPRGGIGAVRSDLGLIVDDARQARVLGGRMPQAVELAEHPVEQAAGTDAQARLLTARAGQVVLMFLTMILAGMLLSNLIEEKSSKVIEVLAAAVPVDAIFLGKLVAMLGMSFTGIAVWGGAAGIGILLLAPQMASFPAPAVGWLAFIALALIYFTALFLLLGALFLGIGGQASTVREVQTLSMPVTMGQVGVIVFASAAVGQLDRPIGVAAMIFPWSSPFAMLARAAEYPALWPHAVAVLWQAAWIAFIIRLSAGLFRRSVLKSGGGGWRGLFRRKPVQPAAAHPRK